MTTNSSAARSAHTANHHLDIDSVSLSIQGLQSMLAMLQLHLEPEEAPVSPLPPDMLAVYVFQMERVAESIKNEIEAAHQRAEQCRQ